MGKGKKSQSSSKDKKKKEKRKKERKSEKKSRSRERDREKKTQSGFSAQPPLALSNAPIQEGQQQMNQPTRRSKWGEVADSKPASTLDYLNNMYNNPKTSATPQQAPALQVPQTQEKGLNLQQPMQYTYVPGMNPNILKALNDPTKVRRKIPVPPDPTFNYIGLIIGPKGVSQKKLEEETGCKILVRGRGSQKEGQPPQPDDDEDLHVLVVADTAQQAAIACERIERIILADNEERNRLRQEQMKLIAQSQILTVGVTQQLQTASGIIVTDPNDLSMTTPYGPPSKDAYVYPVPNDCVGLVIGVKGETIQMLKEKSGCRNVQVATDSAPGSSTRNVFIEGDPEAVERCQMMLQEIVDNQRKMTIVPGMRKVEYQVHDQFVALVIGKKGSTIKGINERTGAFVVISQQPEYPVRPEHKAFVISGSDEQIAAAVKEIETLLENARRAYLQKQGIDPSSVPPAYSTYPDMMMMPPPPSSIMAQMAAMNHGKAESPADLASQQAAYQQYMQWMMMQQQYYMPSEPQIEERVVQEYPKKRSK